MGFDIQGKSALVTGAKCGIGKAIVQTFLKHGARKVYCGVRHLDAALSSIKHMAIRFRQCI